MLPSSNPRSLLLAALALSLPLGQGLAADLYVPNARTPVHPRNVEGLRTAGTLPLAPAFALPPPTTSCPGVISNGTVQLGVAPAGHLTTTCATSTVSSGLYGTTLVGLRFVPTNGEAAAPGTPCEGWGVASATQGISGWTSDSCGASTNLTVESFTSSTTSATSVVRVGSTFRVTHRYTPSPVTNFLYQVDVFIENISTTPVADLRYTRGIDYDVLPNTFSEYVTISGGTAPFVLGAVDNGFNSLDPLALNTTSMGGSGNFTDLGPGDLGAHFDFQVGSLAPGQVRSFRSFYGAAGNQPASLNALASVGVTTYSLGQGNWNGTGSPLSSTGAPAGTFGAASGQPNTFMYGFLPPQAPPTCTVECRSFNPNEIYTVDASGTQDICIVNGSSYIIPVAVIYRYGQRIQFNCGTYGSLGTLCNVLPGQDTCNLSVYQNICSSPIYAQACL